MAVIGIDLGTTNSLAAVWQEGKCTLIPNSLGELLTPSVVSVDENGEILTGQIAKERLISHPERTASSFKRFMGTPKEYRLGEKVFYPEDLSSFILRQLKADAEAFLNEPVTEAVISVPAYFNDNQRTATKIAGKLAGLYVERIINEPSAASLAYQRGFDEEKTFLIFDLGGGTLDISVVETFDNIIDIVAISGDNHLGGDDFNQAIADNFYKMYPDLRGELTQNEHASVLKLAEQCKIALSSTNLALMIYDHCEKQYQMSLNNNQLIQISAPLFSRMKEVLRHVLKDSNKNIESIDEIILVGGSSKMPAVRSYIQHLTGKEPKCNVDPDKAIAVGAGIVSGIKCRDEAVKDVVLTDICPFTLGVKVLDDVSNTLKFLPIIERNSTLPASKTHLLQTISNYQKIVNVSVYQGESYRVEDNLFLGELEIDVPPRPAGEVQIVVRFTYDINGILEVEVSCLQNDVKERKVIVSNHSLSAEDIDRRLAELEAVKIHPRDQDENRLLVARGERLFEENSGAIRDMIVQRLEYFGAILEHGNLAEIKKAQRALSQFFDKLECDNFGLYGEGSD